MQQHELARLRQTIMELEFHQSNLISQLNALAMRISTPEDHMQYAQLLGLINGTRASLEQHVSALHQLLALVPAESGRQVSDQAKREIYHLYHASRYTQEALAMQYGVSQSTVNRIVNGAPPQPLGNVNTASL